jgi:hypothetical protein
VERMWTIHKFVDSAMKKLNNTIKIHEDLITFLAPTWLPAVPFVALVERNCQLKTNTTKVL